MVRFWFNCQGGEDALALKRQMDVLGELTRPLADTIMSEAALAELKDFFEEHRFAENQQAE